MKIKLIPVLLLLLVSKFINAQDVFYYVQPLSGTAPSTTTGALKHSEAGSEKNANTIPAVGLPFGMTQWTPQTQTTEVKCLPPYLYKDSLLSGFRASHWISGSCTQDYGSVTIMPVTGSLKTKLIDYSIPFLHKDEISTPAYYKVDLHTRHISAEMSATLRCGIIQFTAQQADSLYVLMMPNSDQGQGFIQIDSANGEISGYNPVHRIYQGWGSPAGFSGYFFMQIEKKIATKGVFDTDAIYDRDSISHHKDGGAFVGFSMQRGEQLIIRMGTSFSSIAGAKMNLQKEIPQTDFNAVVAAAKKTWEKALSQIKVETGNEKDKRIFYTAMYHALQHPRLFNDADGTYPAFAGNYELKKKINGNYYDDFSMWDIYRAQLPMLEILQPGLVNEFIQSLILKGQQGGWLPIFPCWNNYTSAMIGDHTTAFIASAYAKGIRNYDVKEAYRLMRQNAFNTAPVADYINGKGRRALPSYLKYGFIPMEDSVPEAFHKKEQVSRTLEYAYDDYALSTVARDLHYTKDYQQLQQRSLNYKNVFDTQVSMVRGRYANGTWDQSFHPDIREGYITEGTPRQYSLYVPQDVNGLAKLMGGTKQLELALDSLFAKNEYWHGNEPGHQIPFMYNYTAAPWKTQREVRKIVSEEYGDGPGGLSGNDDAGQMSAWYVFAAIGFYPLDPVSGEYLLCSPLFNTATISLLSNQSFTIICHKADPTAIYIQKLMVNGKQYEKNFITQEIITSDGKMEIWLGQKPSAWGTLPASRPSSLSPK